MKRRIEGCLNHWTGAPPQTVAEIRAFHKNVRGYRDVAYNYVIEHPSTVPTATKPEHLIKIGRKLNADFYLEGDEIPAAHAPYNSRYIAVCVVAGPKNPLHPWQKEALIYLNKTLQVRHKYPAEKIGCHGDVNATQCPGPEIRAIIEELKKP